MIGNYYKARSRLHVPDEDCTPWDKYCYGSGYRWVYNFRPEWNGKFKIDEMARNSIG